MSTGQGTQSGVVEVVDEPIVDDHHPVTDAIDADSATDSGDTATAESTKLRDQRAMSRWIRRSPTKLGIAILAVFTVASMALAIWMYVVQYRADQQTDAAAQKAALTAANEGSIALLSYSPESIDRDLAAAKSHLTGEFLTYYGQFTEQIVKPASKQKSIKTTAAVARAAISEMHTDSAVVLLFINQTSMSSDRSEPTLLASSVLVTLNNVDGNWLIAKFDPV
jgi:Mce-associated membrane protein